MNIGSTAGSSFTSGVQAIHQGVNQASRAAQEVVDATTSRPVEQTPSITGPIVQMQQAEHLVAVGGKLVQAEGQQLGTLLDIKA